MPSRAWKVASRARRLAHRIEQLTIKQPESLARYQADPVRYALEQLKVTPTPDQCQILRHLIIPPYKVLVPSAHDVGKTFVAAVACNWWFDVFNPGVVISTAPTGRDVVDLLWTEIRLQRAQAGLPSHFIGTKSPQMWTSEDHYAKGFTAQKGESFSGRHRLRMLFVIDEASGVPDIIFQTLRTMFDPELGHACLVIFNPLTTTSHVYIEDKLEDEKADDRVGWHRFRLSALNHPNVLAGLQGKPKPVPSAVSLQMVNEWVDLWCEPIVGVGDVRATDVEWPPGSGKWYRPGPLFQSRAMGLWPDSGEGVWSDPLWAATEEKTPVFPADNQLPQLGVDCAMGKGDDYHAVHCRWGDVSMHHETSNTMDPVRIADRCVQLAIWCAHAVDKERPAQKAPTDPKRIAIAIDDDGTGNAVRAILQHQGYNAIGIGAGCASTQPTRYHRRRDELWFLTAARARSGHLSVALLDRKTRLRLKKQLMTPAWYLDPGGRRRVEEKEETKDKIDRSPDDADAFNLAYAHIGSGAPIIVEPEIRETKDQQPKHFGKRERGRKWA